MHACVHLILAPLEHAPGTVVTFNAEQLQALVDSLQGLLNTLHPTPPAEENTVILEKKCVCTWLACGVAHCSADT